MLMILDDFTNNEMKMRWMSEVDDGDIVNTRETIFNFLSSVTFFYSAYFLEGTFI